MTIAVAVLAALLLDSILGEPRRLHPLVGFGQLAQALEQRIHGDSIARGMLAVLVLLVPFTLLAVLTRWVPWGVALDVLLLYLAVGRKSLGNHARRVRNALAARDLPAARRWVGFLVSRDTTALDDDGVAKAAVESVLENGNDAIFGAIFWFAVGGAPGVVFHRLANTLDAMWGYRNETYRRFGWAAARLDDVLNFVPSRLTALSYAMAGQFSRALRCWRLQGTTWKSPNAGPVMAAGAGSMGVLIGGPAVYRGATDMRCSLGEGPAPGVNDIDRALRLIRRTLFIWFVALFVGGWCVEYVAAL
jgi:adenosylcobinamide-phosphate synthase